MHIIKRFLNGIRLNAVDLILFIILVTIFNIFFPYSMSTFPDLKKGDIAPKDIVAPFSFQVLKNEELLQKERQAAYNTVPPVIIYDIMKTERIINDFKVLISRTDSLAFVSMKTDERRKYFDINYPEFSAEMKNLLISEKRKYLLNNSFSLLTILLEKGIIADKGAIPYGKDKTITLINQNQEKTINENDILDNSEAINSTKSKIITSFSSNSFLLKYGIELIQYYLRPNVIIDIEETTKRRENARNEIPIEAGMVLKGEIIIRAHDIVSLNAADKLRSLRIHRTRNDSPLSDFSKFLVKNLIFFVILLLYFIFINTQFSGLMIKFRDKIIITIFIAGNIASYGFFYQFPYIEYMLPLIITATVFSLLFSRTFSLVSIVFIIAAMIIYSGLRLQGLLSLFLASIYSIYLIKQMEKRTQFIQIILKVSIIAVIISFCIEIFRESAFNSILINMLASAINVFVSILLLILFLPFIERFLNRITNITLLDLSDLNNKLLKMEAEKATGTFHHSLTVSNMSEHAAKVIGADELLARVGAYYHDIGKLVKPEYFIENQSSDFNPHKSLPPELSAEIIKEHISNGEKLAISNKLPKKISEFILTHHGTSYTDYFLNKAKERKDNVDKEKFRYSGPLPESRETTIVMLADSVEAAVKSLRVREDKTIRKMIDFIFDKKLNEGQLDNSSLSIKEINLIKEEFVSIMLSVYHTRVEYKYNDK